jgi:hypothetical protein
MLVVNHVIYFYAGKCFGLAREVEVNTAGGRKGEALSAADPTVFGTSFRGVSIGLSLELNLLFCLRVW